jgi:uncharacterized protein (DUF1499 family)
VDQQTRNRKLLANRRLGVIMLTMSLFSCAGTRPTNLGLHDAVLGPCPSSPNCVSSDARDAAHRVEAFELAVPSAEAWRAARAAVADLSRSVIVTETPDYLHAECASAFFGFVDDLELHLRASEGRIAVRSASRLGHSDMGVNRRRVEGLRSELARQGVVR